jgi:hypothetical protein
LKAPEPRNAGVGFRKNVVMSKAGIFCGGPGPFSNEHVLPEWIAELLQLQLVGVSTTKTGEPERLWTSVGSFGATVGAVCETKW